MKAVFHVLLGIILGIILLVIAVGGAVYAVITVPVGDVLNTFNLQVLPPDHVLLTQSILDIIQSALNDVQNINNLSIKELSERYGIPLPPDIHGISLDPILSEKIGVLTSNPDNAITSVVNSVNLSNILSLAGVPEENLTKFPIFEENMENNIQDTMKTLTTVLDPSSLTLRSFKQNFNVSLGDMELLDKLQDLPINNFADAFKTIDIGTVLDVDSDQFIANTNIPLYVKVDRVEKLSTKQLNDKDAAGNKTYQNDFAKKYIYEIKKEDKDGKTIYTQMSRDLRFVKRPVKTTPPTGEEPKPEAQAATADPVPPVEKDPLKGYKVDNSSYDSEFVADDNTEVFYFVEYEPYDASKHDINKDKLFIPYVINSFVSADGTTFAPKVAGFISADDIFLDISTNATPSFVTLKEELAKQTEDNPSVTLTNGIITSLDKVYYEEEVKAEGEGTQPETIKITQKYGYESKGANKNTKLEEGKEGFFKVHKGSSDMAIQHLAGLTVNELSNPQDAILSLKLGDVLKLEEDNILYTLANTPIGDIPDKIGTLTIKNVMPNLLISAYIKADNGTHILVGDYENAYFTVYNEDKASTYFMYNLASLEDLQNAGIDKYEKQDNGDFIKATTFVDGTKYYIRQTVTQRYNVAPDYVVATASHLKADTTQKYNLEYKVEGSTLTPVFTPVAQANIIKGQTYYVKLSDLGEGAKADSKLLQRIANTSINGVSKLIDTVVLGDIMEITEDNILYNFAGCTIQEIPDELDTLTIDKVITNITFGAYTEATDGIYIYVGEDENGYYTIYDVDKKDTYFIYSPATEDQIQDTMIPKFEKQLNGDFKPATTIEEGKKYYVRTKSVTRYNYSEYVLIPDDDPKVADTNITKYEKDDDGQFVPHVTTGKQYYIKADSKLLQRIAHTNIKGIKDLMNKLVLGEIMDVTEDNILYNFIGCTIQEIPAKIDTLTIDKIIKDITFGEYTEDEKGLYIRVGDNENSYYTVYNEDKADSYFLYTLATPEEIAGPDTKYEKNLDGSFKPATTIEEGKKYYVRTKSEIRYNYSEYVPIDATDPRVTDSNIEKYEKSDDGKFVPYVTSGKQHYIKADSKLLQRIAHTNVKGIKNLMNDLVLGEIMDITEENILSNFMGCTIQEIPAQLDTLTIDKIIKNITVGTYTENVNGPYVYVGEKDHGYYTIYNPNNAGTYFTYTLASEAQKADGSIDKYVKAANGDFSKVTGALEDKVKYYIQENSKRYTYCDYVEIDATHPKYNDTSVTKYQQNDDGKFVEHTDTTKPYYIKADSKILQRLASTGVKQIGSLINGLVLGDVMALDLDVMEVLIEQTNDESQTIEPELVDISKCFYFDTMYKRAKYDTDNKYFVDKDGNKFIGTIYTATTEGTSHPIIKRLATVGVNEMGNAMKDVIDTLYFTDLFTIVQQDEVKVTDSTSAKDFFVAESKGYNAAFVKDPDGVYFQSETTYYELDDALKATLKNSTGTYTYTQLTGLQDYTLSAALQNVYVKVMDNGVEKYVFNPAWSTYLALTKKEFTNLYKRTSGTGYEYSTYRDNNHQLYVAFLGTYIPYDATNPAHSDLPLAIKLENGYYPLATDPTLTTNQDYIDKYNEVFYFNETNTYTKLESTTVVDLNSVFKFIKLPEIKSGSGQYYYNKITDFTTLGDPNKYNKDVDVTFSKKTVNDIKFISGEGKTQTIETKRGYIAKANEVDGLESQKITILKAKSATLLRNLASSQKAVTEIDSILKDFHIDQLMDIDQGSFLARFNDAKLSDLPNRLTKEFNTMTIKDLVETMHITAMNPKVLSVIGGVTFPDFFRSLTFDESSGSIAIDMNKLFENAYTTK